MRALVFELESVIDEQSVENDVYDQLDLMDDGDDEMHLDEILDGSFSSSSSSDDMATKKGKYE